MYGDIWLKKRRSSQAGLNHRPLDYKSSALPLSYASVTIELYSYGGIVVKKIIT